MSKNMIKFIDSIKYAVLDGKNIIIGGGEYTADQLKDILIELLELQLKEPPLKNKADKRDNKGWLDEEGPPGYGD